MKRAPIRYVSLDAFLTEMNRMHFELIKLTHVSQLIIPFIDM